MKPNEILTDLLEESIKREERNRRDRLFDEWQKLDRQERNDLFCQMVGWLGDNKDFNDAFETILKNFKP